MWHVAISALARRRARLHIEGQDGLLPPQSLTPHLPSRRPWLMYNSLLADVDGSL